MPCILKIKVIGGRDLPVMDKASDLTDAYVEVKFADFEAQRTTVCRKTLNPTWNEDFRFEVTDDADLQNEPLELKVLDYDAITANDSVGSVFIDLNPLLPVNSPWQIAGWFPIYDTIRGVRGEVNVQVKLQFFGDVNPFKDSSAGIMFFSTTSLPAGYQIVAMHGFVDAIVNEDDPEYHWSDSFRTQRSSNEARQRLLFRLSGQLRRLLGKETLDMGGNAVLGYQQCFDLESEEHAITARAVGTAVKIAIVSNSTPPLSPMERVMGGMNLGNERDYLNNGSSSYNNNNDNNNFNTGHHHHQQQHHHQPQQLEDTPLSAGLLMPYSNNFGGASAVGPKSPEALLNSRRRGSQDSGSSTTNSAPSVKSAAKNSINNYKYLEQQIFTLHEFPPGTIFNLGGIVSARSVKLIEDDNVETREGWWDELRDEIKSHARVVGCSHIIGYQEMATINDELIVLSAIGTAANLDMTAFTPGILGEGGRNLSRSGSIGRSYHDNNNPMENLSSSFGIAKASVQSSTKEQQWLEMLAKRKSKRKQPSACRMCHIPFHRKTSPFPMSFVKCSKCKKKYVPEILLSTVEPPAELGVIGQGVFVEAHVCRAKKRKEGESNASIVSDAIPFVEYDLHRQLMYKLKIHGLNAIFGLRFQITIGDALIVAVACGTAMYLSALPTPPALRISRNLDVIDEEDKKLLEMQRKIMKLSEDNRQNIEAAKNREAEEEDAMMGIPTRGGNEDDSSGSSSDSEDDAEKGNYQTNVVVQIDDDADEDLMAVLLDPVFADGFLLCSTETLPNHPYFVATDPMIPDNAHLITTVKQGHISMVTHHPNRQLAALFRSIYEDLRFRLSYFTDCVLAGISYNIQLPRANEVQIQLTAVALGQQRQMDTLEPLGIPVTLSPWRSHAGSTNLSTGTNSRAGSEAYLRASPTMITTTAATGSVDTMSAPTTTRRRIVSENGTSNGNGVGNGNGGDHGADEAMVFQMEDSYPLSESPVGFSNSTSVESMQNNNGDASGQQQHQQQQLQPQQHLHPHHHQPTLTDLNTRLNASTRPAGSRDSLVGYPHVAATAPTTPTRERRRLDTGDTAFTAMGPDEAQAHLSIPQPQRVQRADIPGGHSETLERQATISQVNSNSSSSKGKEKKRSSMISNSAHGVAGGLKKALSQHSRHRSISSLLSHSSNTATPVSKQHQHDLSMTPTFTSNMHQNVLQPQSLQLGPAALQAQQISEPHSHLLLHSTRPFIEMTPLSFIPGRTPTRYLGKLSLHFVKETHVVHDTTVSSGMGGFVHVFLMEVQAVARSHVAALGGDAIVGLRVDESFFQESVKNQGYALISISGDVVGCRSLYEDTEDDDDDESNSERSELSNSGEEEEEEEEDDEDDEDDGDFEDEEDDEEEDSGSQDLYGGRRSGEGNALQEAEGHVEGVGHGDDVEDIQSSVAEGEARHPQ